MYTLGPQEPPPSPVPQKLAAANTVVAPRTAAPMAAPSNQYEDEYLRTESTVGCAFSKF